MARRAALIRTTTVSGRKLVLTETERTDGTVLARASVDGWQAGMLMVPVDVWEDLKALQMNGGSFPYECREGRGDNFVKAAFR